MNTLKSVGSRLRVGLFLIPLLFLVAFFFYPLTNILQLSLTTEAVTGLFTRSYLLETVWFTFWQASLSTILTLIFGLPAAYLFARYDFWGKSFLRALVTVPFVLPTVVVAIAFQALLGPGGPINGSLMRIFGLDMAPLRLEQTLTMILLAHIYYNIAVVIRLVGGYWANLNPRMTEAARVLGASPAKAFLEITDYGLNTK